MWVKPYINEGTFICVVSVCVCVCTNVCVAFLCFICYGLVSGRTLFFLIQTYPFILHQAVNTWTTLFFFLTLVSLHLNWMEC